MKTKTHMKGCVGIVMISLILFGCGKDEVVNPEFQKMTFESQEVLDKLPAGLLNSSDEHAEECISMIEDALDMSQFIENMDVPQGAEKVAKKSSSNTWRWSVNVQGYNYTFYWTYSEDASGDYQFTMTWDGEDGIEDYYLTYVVVVNEDGSGSIEYWLMGYLVYEMEWDALGNGTWAYYSGGEELMSGSWTAG